MKKSIVLSAGSAVAASALMALFGTGVAAADDYAGQTYADASSAASDAGLTVVVAGRVGDKVAQDECLVTRFADRTIRHAPTTAPTTTVRCSST